MADTPETGNGTDAEDSSAAPQADVASAQIDDFINVNIAQIAPDYSNFVNNNQGFDDASGDVQLNLDGGLPSGFSLSTGSAITISPDSWSGDGSSEGEADSDEISDFDSDGDSLEAEAVVGELRAGDAAGQQPQADSGARGSSSAAAGQSGGAAAAASSAASGAAAAQPVAAAGPAARPGQASRPGRSGNIDQQQSTSVFDQLTAEVVITSVAIVPAIALPSLAAAETDTASALQSNDVRALPETEATDRAQQEAAAAANRAEATTAAPPPEAAAADEVVVEAAAEEATAEQEAVPQDTVAEPEVIEEAPAEVEAAAEAVEEAAEEALIEEIIEELEEAVEEVEPVEDEVIAAANDAVDDIVDEIVDAVTPVPEPAPEPAPSPSPAPTPTPRSNSAPTVTAITDSGKTEDSAAYTIDLLNGAADADSDTLSVTNSSITAVDQAGNAYTLPNGAASVSGSTLSIDPSTLSEMALGDEVVITVSYDVSDGTTTTANTATVTLDGTNEAPTVTAITDSGKTEDSAAYTIDLLNGAADADSDTLSVTNSSITAVDQAGNAYTLPNGAASVSGSTLSIDPSTLSEMALGDEVVITVSYDVSDGTTTTANTATVTLDGTNEAPTVTAITDTGKTEDSAAYTIDLLNGAADADGDTLSVTNTTITAVDQAGNAYTLPNGAASMSNSTLSIDPSTLSEMALGDEVVITVSYDVWDGITTTANTATVTLDGTNEAPTVTAITDTGKTEDSAAYTIDLLNGAADADGDTLSVTNTTITAVDQAGNAYTLPNGAASVSNSTLSIDPSTLSEMALGDEVVITVSYDVWDGITTTANTATVTLDGTNEAPTVTAITDTGKTEDSAAYTIDLLNGAADADGDTLSVTNTTITAVGQAGNAYTLPNGAASVSNSTLSIDPSTLSEMALGDEVVITVSYDVSDGTTTTANTATVTLDGTNEAPTVTAITDTGKTEDSAAYTIDLLNGAADADGDTLSVSNSSIAAIDGDGNAYSLPNGTVSISGSTLSINPSTLNGLDTGEEVVIRVTYNVSDGTTTTANTARVTLNGVNDAPTASPTSNTLSEQDSTFTLNLLDAANDVDVETLTVRNVSITAVDSDGNAVPDNVVTATASVSGPTLTIDPNQLDGLNDGQYANFTVAYNVSDGDASVSTQATVRINGYTDPFVTITPPNDFNLAENAAGDTTAVSLGQISANGHTTVSYSFANGTQADGDYRIDSSTGAITYVGTGEDYEEGVSPTNIAGSASLSTTVTTFYQATVDQALASMVDGNTSTSGANDYAVNPQNADGETITFDFDENYTDPTFIFYNRSWDAVANRIDGTTVEYKYQGQTVHTETLNSANEVNDTITLDSPDNFRFDQVVMTFSGDDQNFREVEIIAKRAPVQSLEVQATSGSVSDTVYADVVITDVNEAVVVANALADQTGIRAKSSSFTIPADSFNDPDGTAINYTATLADGSGLPSWLIFDPNARSFSITNQSPSGRFEVRVSANSGGSTVTDDFTLFMTENHMSEAVINSGVTAWASGDTQSNINAMTDGNTSTSGAADYSVQPQNADGQEIIFDMQGSFQAGSFAFYNRTSGTEAELDRINGSTVTFKNNGSNVFTGTLSRQNAIDNVITLSPAIDIVFDEIVLAFDGDDQNFREIEIYGSPFVTFTSAASFGINENTSNLDVFTVAASADDTVTYRFANGTQASGDYEINANTGVITYNGSGHNFETMPNANVAPSATITTTVTNFLNYTVEQALANMVDGSTSTAGSNNYSVHPRFADGQSITFDFDQNYTNPTFVFYSRTGDSVVGLIDGSTVEYNYHGQTVHTETLDSSTHNNYVITVSSQGPFKFDQVVLTFDGETQNFREIEIFADPAPGDTLYVEAVSGSYTRTQMVDVVVNDVNEAPTTNGSIADQSVQEGDKVDFSLPDDIFVDPEGDDLTLSATLVDGSELPSFIMFDENEGDFLFEPGANDAEKYDIRVYASDGEFNTYVDFTLSVEDVL